MYKHLLVTYWSRDTAVTHAGPPKPTLGGDVDLAAKPALGYFSLRGFVGNRPHILRQTGFRRLLCVSELVLCTFMLLFLVGQVRMLEPRASTVWE